MICLNGKGIVGWSELYILNCLYNVTYVVLTVCCSHTLYFFANKVMLNNQYLIKYSLIKIYIYYSKNYLVSDSRQPKV